MKNDTGDFNRSLFKSRTDYCREDHAKPFNFKKLLIFVLVIRAMIYFKEDISILAKELM
jgi:hypothetical protein